MRTMARAALLAVVFSSAAGAQGVEARAGEPGAALVPAVLRGWPAPAATWEGRQRGPSLLGYTAAADTARARMPRFWRAVIGGAAGATVGAVGGSAYARQRCGELISCESQAVMGGLVWGFLGFVVGGALGATGGR